MSSESEIQNDSGVAIEPSQLAELKAQLNSLESSSLQYPTTISVSALDLDPWRWLNANQDSARIAWLDRETRHITAGVGVAASVEMPVNGDMSDCLRRCRGLINGNSDLKFFGGFSFDGIDGWKSLGAGRFRDSPSSVVGRKVDAGGHGCR